jgi:hypothetical protein
MLYFFPNFTYLVRCFRVFAFPRLNTTAVGDVENLSIDKRLLFEHIFKRQVTKIVGWIRLVQGSSPLWALVSTTINQGIPKKAESLSDP